MALRTRTQFAVLASSAAFLAIVACGNHRQSDKRPPPTCINSCVPDPGSRAMTQKDCDDAESGIEFLPLPIWDMGPVYDSNNEPTKSIATGMYYYDDKTAIIRVPGKIWEPTTEYAYSGKAPIPLDGQVVGEPPTGAVGRCGESLPNPNDSDFKKRFSTDVHYALHVAGGPFLEWGGGMGRMLKCMNTDEAGTQWLKELNINKYLCVNRKSTTYHHYRINKDGNGVVQKDPSGNIQKTYIPLAACTTTDDTPIEEGSTTTYADVMKSVCPNRDIYYKDNNKTPDETDEPYMTGMALDLSMWEGIAFWARRSPNSQEGIRIAVADKYVDDDMSYLSMRYDEQHPGYNQQHPRYCERKVVCGCQNNKPCTTVKVVDNVFDADGNRIKWATATKYGRTRSRLAVDGDKIDDVEHYQNLVEELRKRHSLINMSGVEIVNPKTGSVTFDDGTPVYTYNGPPPGNGQAYDTDLFLPREESFCFDPAVDPVPPEGTPLSQILNRGFQSLRTTASNPTHYVPSGPNGFFTNTAKGVVDQQEQTDWNGVQLRVTDFDHAELPGYNYSPCGATFCNFEYPSFQARDPQTLGRSCTPFPYKGGITYSHCYNPGKDPDPPEGSQQCGDYWLKPVALTTDWQLHKVPFTSLIQQGWAKRSYKLDLSSITDVRIQWDRGWLDVWISDVRFYRTKKL